jgi:hypothetical protein
MGRGGGGEERWGKHGSEPGRCHAATRQLPGSYQAGAMELPWWWGGAVGQPLPRWQWQLHSFQAASRQLPGRFQACMYLPWPLLAWAWCQGMHRHGRRSSAEKLGRSCRAGPAQSDGRGGQGSKPYHRRSRRCLRWRLIITSREYVVEEKCVAAEGRRRRRGDGMPARPLARR